MGGGEIGERSSRCARRPSLGITGAEASGRTDGTGEGRPCVLKSGTLKGASGAVLPATARLTSLSAGAGMSERATIRKR